MFKTIAAMFIPLSIWCKAHKPNLSFQILNQSYKTFYLKVGMKLILPNTYLGSDGLWAQMERIFLVFSHLWSLHVLHSSVSYNLLEYETKYLD